MRRIFSHDADEMMPPPAANKPLSDAKRRILRDWIAAGRRIQIALGVRPAAASAAAGRSHGPSWPRNPIDDFVLARLEVEPA